MRGRRSLIVPAVVVPILLLVSPGLWNISISTTRHDLEVIGGAVYEFHDQFGKWPALADDLGRTSLPSKMPSWKAVLSTETVVILWPKNIDSAPRNNASVVLAYHKRGLISAFGHKWVCWVNLRTECLANGSLQDAIAAQLR